MDQKNNETVSTPVVEPVNEKVDASLFIPKEERLDVVKLSRAQKAWKITINILVYALLIVLAIVILFPFYWMINSSLKDLAEYKRSTPTFWPEVVHFENYMKAFEAADFYSSDPV